MELKEEGEAERWVNNGDKSGNPFNGIERSSMSDTAVATLPAT